MGVPSFIRWLVNKYPKVVAKAIHHHNKLDDEPPDTSLPNPNSMEFDNLYLDMNGIIHPCFHPESDEDAVIPPTTFEEVFINIFEYIDRLFDIVRPRQLLYLAIDGVAPRAKMNQQRTRRFKSAKDKELAEEVEEMLRRRFKLEGKQVLPKQDQSQVSDSNIITPGTDFMYKLSNALRSYINSRLSNDSGWRNIKVILSDANVAGEGEHKIISFIRQQRNLPLYNPNTRHCLYGLDADLIMLALATHEVHFSILREDVLNPEQPRTNRETIGETSSSSAKSDDKKSFMIAKPYQFVHVWILREYLELDMEIKDPPENFKFDLERVIDDFIFICFFAGNDFLPHMPTLCIHEGAIDLLMTVYKKEFKNLGGYLVDMLKVNEKKWVFIKLSRVEKFILHVGAYEEKIFKKRSELHERKLKRLCHHHDESLEEETDAGSSAFDSSNTCAFLAGEETEVSIGTFDHNLHSQIVENTKELKQKLKDNIRRKSDLFKNGDLGTDKVRLAAPGYKERYYKHKFSAEGPGDIESKRKAVVKYYTEGLLWVLMYYFSGPPSWTWFYRFHYGPFASDLKGIAQVKPKFQKGSPFKPIDTLMAVLPPRSAHALPRDYQKLMTDESSKISDFYPSDFEIDMDGKRFTWQGICKLPFIEEDRLLTETKKLEKELMGEERDRNTEKSDRLFVRRTHTFTSKIVSLSANENRSIKIDACLSFGIGGSICLLDAAMGKEGDGKLEEDNVLCVMYKLLDSGRHLPQLLDGVEHPIKRITKDELIETQLWHEYQGSTPTYTSTTKSGSGWGYGRVKPISTPDSFGNYCNTPMGKHDDYKSFQGFKDLKISGSSQGRRPNGRAQSVNNDFWPSRNGFVHDTNNYAWKHPDSQSIHPIQGRGRGQHDYSSTHYSPFAANRSSPASGRGRAHFVQRGSINEGNRPGGS